MNGNIRKIRNIHGRLHEWRLHQQRKLSIYNAYIHTRKSAKGYNSCSEDYPIDFVVTWVDGNDIRWQSERNKYSVDSVNPEDCSSARFRDWDNFEYWFRSVEKNAPWVNNVYLVTYGHLPKWINLNSKKLKIITHSDFIPHEYLPTFSSHTIEWNLWRIPGLSEHFVYFNDDVFLLNKVEKNDFFLNGLPKYTAIAKPIETFSKMAAHRHALLNNLGIINSNFDIRECMEKHLEKWFNSLYGGMNKYNVLAYEDEYISGMYYSHLGMPYRKSAMIDVYNHFTDRIHQTCLNRFRTSDDIMHQLVQMWEMMNGTFEPVGPDYYGTFITPDKDKIDDLAKKMNDPKSLMICVNDHSGLNDEEFDLIKGRVNDLYEHLFPEKSSFEN